MLLDSHQAVSPLADRRGSDDFTFVLCCTGPRIEVIDKLRSKVFLKIINHSVYLVPRIERDLASVWLAAQEHPTERNPTCIV